MKLDNFIHEPVLEFGKGGTSYDIREGICKYGPVDHGTPRSKNEVRLGFVGTPKTIAAFSEWMTVCGDGIESENPLNLNLSPGFPGLSPDVGFRVKFITDPSWITELPEREINKICSEENATSSLANKFHKEIDALFELNSSPPDVVICLPPDSVRKRVRPRFMRKSDFDRSIQDLEEIDFHDYLKGLCLETKSIFQLVWPRTYSSKSREVQDPSIRAWNLFGALFYKAGGVPWKLLKTPLGHNTCYVGISFSQREDGKYTHSSLTQIFNDKGEGTILRGGIAHKSQDDREVHLPEESAFDLLKNAIANFQLANNGRKPDRVVVHKTSGYDSAELNGFNSALDDADVKFSDLLALNPSDIRLFRYGAYPPLRGTHMILDEHTSILYTRGSVAFYRKYPGPYVPKTLQIRYFQTDRDPTDLAAEILALTKLNWNKTQFDSFFPITIGGSKQIGTIYKWCPNPPSEAITYAFFM